MIKFFIAAALVSLILFTPMPSSAQEAVQESNPEPRIPNSDQQIIAQESKELENEEEEKESEPGIILPEVIVEEEPLVEERGYKVENSSTATRTDTPLIDTPRSVGIVNRRLIDDRAIIDPQEAVQNVSGVQRAAGRTGGD